MGAFYLNRNSFLGGLADFLHSTQQDLDLRTTLGGGYGRFLVRTNSSRLQWLGGLVYTRESFNAVLGQPLRENVEGLLGIEYSWFRFNVGSIDSQVLVFPGLSDAGRFRVTTNTSLTIKLPNNFGYVLTFWDNYDSRPPATAQNNDLGVSSSIGYSF